MKKNAVTSGSSADFIGLIEDMPDSVMALSKALTKCIKATRAQDGTSTLTFKLKILSKSGGESVEIVPMDPTASLPKKKHSSRFYFTSDHGQLLREHPHQLNFLNQDDPKVVRD